MKWAVEAKVFGDGRIVARVRPAKEDVSIHTPQKESDG